MWIYLLAALAIGFVFAFQPAINAIISRATGSSFSAASISVAITLFTLLLLLPVFGAGDISFNNIARLPIWTVLGGVIGVVVVAGGLFIAPRTGVALFFVFLVAGQLLGAAIIDHYGWFGIPVSPVNPLKLAGLLLVLVGTLLVRSA